MRYVFRFSNLSTTKAIKQKVYSFCMIVTFVIVIMTLLRSQAKKLILIRHGLTEMNELVHGKWGTPEFIDAKLWDTKLSPTGILQTQQLNALMKDYKGVSINTSEIELLVASPLHRALHTAELVFKDKLPSNVTRIAHPLFRERVYMSSEIGQQKQAISALHPEWNYDHLPDEENWWYEHKSDEDKLSYVEWRPKDGQYSCPGEPRDVFRSRVIEARHWLIARPENCIAVVAHKVLLRALTGRVFDNCEAVVMSSDELLEEPFIA